MPPGQTGDSCSIENTAIFYHHYEISAAFSWSMPYQSPIVLAIINLREPSAYKEQGEDDDNNNDNNNDDHHLDETLSL